MKAVCEEAWRLVGHRAADVCCGTKGGTHPLSPAVHLMFVTAHFELPSAADCRPPASVCGLCGGVCCVWWRLLCGGGVGGGCVACAFICLDPGRQFDVGWHHTHTHGWRLCGMRPHVLVRESSASSCCQCVQWQGPNVWEALSDWCCLLCGSASSGALWF